MTKNKILKTLLKSKTPLTVDELSKNFLILLKIYLIISAISKRKI